MSKKKMKIMGSVSYDDPATPLSFHSTNITILNFSGNQAHIGGSGKIGKSKVTFTVDVTDNGYPGTNDFFSIHFSNGYSASGNPTTGGVQIH